MLTLLHFAFANLARRRLRTAVTMAGVATAIALSFCLVSFQRGYQAGMRTELDRLGAHLLVVPKGCPYDAASMALHGANWPCYLKGSYLQMVRTTPHVAVAAPVLMSAIYEPKTEAQDVYCGVDPDILRLKRLWRIKGQFPAVPGDILAGSEMARKNHWRLGQQILLPGLDRQRGRVTGILAPTEGADDVFLFLGLRDAQRLFQRPNQLTHILVRLDAPESLDGVVSQLRGCDAGLDMNIVPLAHLFQTINDLVQSTRLLLVSAALVAVLAAGAGVSNTVMMAVTERTREIGVLRAVGVSRGSIFGLIWLETAFLCLAGSLAGIVTALGGSRLVEAWLRARLPFAPQDVLIRPEGIVFFLCLLGSLALSSLAALAPAWRASRLSPAEAIRTAGG